MVLIVYPLEINVKVRKELCNSFSRLSVFGDSLKKNVHWNIFNFIKDYCIYKDNSFLRFTIQFQTLVMGQSIGKNYGHLYCSKKYIPDITGHFLQCSSCPGECENIFKFELNYNFIYLLYEILFITLNYFFI